MESDLVGTALHVAASSHSPWETLLVIPMGLAAVVLAVKLRTWLLGQATDPNVDGGEDGPHGTAEAHR